MRWTERPYPKNGDRRTIRRFLLFPKWIGGQGRWLEVAEWREVFTDDHTDSDWHCEWVAERWID